MIRYVLSHVLLKESPTSKYQFKQNLPFEFPMMLRFIFDPLFIASVLGTSAANIINTVIFIKYPEKENK